MPSTATGSRKRKQLDEMEESPPKRVTRARTTKASGEDGESKATNIMAKAPRLKSANRAKGKKTTRITTESVKALATFQQTAETSAAKSHIEKRGSSADEGSADELESVEPRVLSKQRRERSKEPNESQPTKASRPRGRPSKVSTAVTGNATTTTRKPAPKLTDVMEIEDERMTKTTSAMRSARMRNRTATKNPEGCTKKVTFDDELSQDKENKPIQPKASQSKNAPATSASRKNALSKPKSTSAGKDSKTATSFRKPAIKKGGKPCVKSTPPLSPKKVIQVAKSVSSSEDELCEKSPMRALSKSPKKAPLSTGSAMELPPKLDPHLPPKSPSPSRSHDVSVLRSPAKRPPPSPFKDTIKQSPIKFNPNQSPVRSEVFSSQPQYQNSMKASPRKVNLAASTSAGSMFPDQPSFKASLLQSPAKRPISPERTRLFPSVANATAGQAEQSLKVPIIPPQDVDASPDLGQKAVKFTGNLDPTNPNSTKSPSPDRVSTVKAAFAQYKDLPLDAHQKNLAQQERVQPLFTDYYRNNTDGDNESEDESPAKSQSDGTPTFIFKTPNGKIHRQETMGITPLALKMSTWCAASPGDNQAIDLAHHQSNIEHPSPDNEGSEGNEGPESNFFEQEMMDRRENSQSPQASNLDVLEDLHLSQDAEGEQPIEAYKPHSDDQTVISHSEELAFQPELAEISPNCGQLYPIDVPVTASGFDASVAHSHGVHDHENEDCEQYGDENVIPIDPAILGEATQNAIHFENSLTNHQTPETPRVVTHRRQEIHTVSKVPVRMDGPEQSPITIARKRSKSFNVPLGELPELSNTSLVCNTLTPDEHAKPGNRQAEELASASRKVSYETSIINALLTPVSGARSAANSPVKSVRSGKDAQILRGAVVYVDVHTSEGAEASSIFVELLTQMGARFVKQWTWKPRHTEARDVTPSGKVGITHVVFKDGGKRTLQKVREAKGLVLCVGVSWVLDCEREDRWLDEAPYAIDTSTIPRGGHNRRKSMEPRIVSNHHGTLVPAQPETPLKGAYEVSSPTSEFRAFGAASRRSSIRVSPLPTPKNNPLTEQTNDLPATPTVQVRGEDELCDLASWNQDIGSPTTPYFLSKGAMLIQQTCPPKQTGQPLFPVTGRIEDQPDERMRQRLQLARRKSLQWAPKIQSPLGRTVSFGK